MSVITFIQSAYGSLSSFISCIYTFIVTVIDMNFKAVTVTVETCEDILTTVVNVFRVLYNLLSNVFSSAFDFLYEIFGLVHAIVLVLWKFLVFLGSVCYSIYQFIEILLYFIVSHVVWLVQILTGSALNFKELSIKLFEFISHYSVLTFKQIFAGIGIIGTATVSGITTFFTSFKWTLTSLWSNIDNGMMAFAESVRYITDMSYYGMIDFMYLKRETYIGLLICLLIFLFIANVFKTLKQRGMTFPGIRDNFDVGYIHARRARPNFGFDFSDNEEDESDENYEVESDESDVTIASSEADDDEEVDEYEVDDLTTDEEELSDSDSTASIDIQLPPVNSGGYNFRRSTTPSRLNVHSTEDFQKEIEKEKEKIKCVVCQDNDKSVLILPCKHLCLCLHCGNTIARSRNVERRVCPLCRKKIETIMNVYT